MSPPKKPDPEEQPTPPPRPLDPRQELKRLRELLKLMSEHDLEELEIGPDGHALRLTKRGAHPASAPMVAAAAPAPAPVEPIAAEAPPADSKEDGNVEPFLSPMVGTFYRAPSPEAPPYVKGGDFVEPTTVLCMIEAMKVFNEIQCESTGQIVETLVENGEAVEYGQPLFQIRRTV